MTLRLLELNNGISYPTKLTPARETTSCEATQELPEGSLQCSQERSTGIYPEQDNTVHNTPFSIR
jgi:hypothetical protein